MRINEILDLTENYFNFDYYFIKVNKTLSCCKIFENEKEYKRQIIVTTPKSKTSNRIVYFNHNISKDIKNYITIQKERYLKFGKKYTPDNIIFTNKRFEYLNYRGLEFNLKTILSNMLAINASLLNSIIFIIIVYLYSIFL